MSIDLSRASDAFGPFTALNYTSKSLIQNIGNIEFAIASLENAPQNPE